MMNIYAEATRLMGEMVDAHLPALTTKINRMVEKRDNFLAAEESRRMLLQTLSLIHI